MIIPLVCFVGGLFAMGRTKPQTAVRKMVCLGPRTGIVYSVEHFAEVGSFVVRAPGGGAVAQFIRRGNEPGLVWQNGQGHPDLLEAMRRDFGVEAQKPVAVPKPAVAQEKSA